MKKIIVGFLIASTFASSLFSSPILSTGKGISTNMSAALKVIDKQTKMCNSYEVINNNGDVLKVDYSNLLFKMYSYYTFLNDTIKDIDERNNAIFNFKLMLTMRIPQRVLDYWKINNPETIKNLSSVPEYLASSVASNIIIKSNKKGVNNAVFLSIVDLACSNNNSKNVYYGMRDKSYEKFIFLIIQSKFSDTYFMLKELKSLDKVKKAQVELGLYDKTFKNAIQNK